MESHINTYGKRKTLQRAFKNAQKNGQNTSFVVEFNYNQNRCPIAANHDYLLLYVTVQQSGGWIEQCGIYYCYYTNCVSRWQLDSSSTNKRDSKLPVLAPQLTDFAWFLPHRNICHPFRHSELSSCPNATRLTAGIHR